MQVEENVSLKPYNTFGIDVSARYFSSVSSIAALKEILKHPLYKSPFFIGGGSNLLFTKDYNGSIIHLNHKGISVVNEDNDCVWIEAMAGENWHNFVLYCIDNNYGGIENLSLIPGNVGTAPVQNIGAYGVELKDIFYSCTAIMLNTLQEETFLKEDCNFEYRNSIFKNELKGRCCIIKVTFKLTKNNHKLSTSYGAIQQELDYNKIKNPTIKDISDAVITIRKSKLPDPNEIGNSGSFFKNPIINKESFDLFIDANPEAPYYKVSNELYKIPAGWLIEQCGFKGKRYGDAGVHKKQALVLVNYGNASGKEIWDLALKVQKKVHETFAIRIEPEVNVI